MSHVPHELAEEFPAYADRISALKQSDKHFAHLMAQYHDINRQVHRVETNVEPMDSLAENDLRKKRAALKDQIYAILSHETA
ncbi:DUF465 domain-containing protein [Salipiger sp. P9]|uniref:YdcH family protein n=1 Tax=Salipiger pentaromativorans TaxID=2943193 RepID=UPI0021581A4D|nr:DUF465 domain-containing protein [Salipiger pentaromativorans]MCR8546397.1 DUF465 domain-containing protein [Salipiger pentaromativorans]